MVPGATATVSAARADASPSRVSRRLRTVGDGRSAASSPPSEGCVGTETVAGTPGTRRGCGVAGASSVGTSVGRSGRRGRTRGTVGSVSAS